MIECILVQTDQLVDRRLSARRRKRRNWQWHRSLSVWRKMFGEDAPHWGSYASREVSISSPSLSLQQLHHRCQWSEGCRDARLERWYADRLPHM